MCVHIKAYTLNKILLALRVLLDSNFFILFSNASTTFANARPFYTLLISDSGPHLLILKSVDQDPTDAKNIFFWKLRVLLRFAEKHKKLFKISPNKKVLFMHAQAMHLPAELVLEAVTSYVNSGPSHHGRGCHEWLWAWMPWQQIPGTVAASDANCCCSEHWEKLCPPLP